MANSSDAGNLWRRIWQELATAVGEPGHGWRTPVLASVDGTGAPRARMVVLRGVSEVTQSLWFFTDQRSPKVTQLAGDARTALVLWSAQQQWQLRVEGTATIDADSERVDAAWQRIATTPAAADYLAPLAPGTPLTASSGSTATDHALAIVTVRVVAMDWLALNTSGHRRALVTGSGVTWITP